MMVLVLLVVNQAETQFVTLTEERKVRIKLEKN
jgi:hypothetical protein